MTRRKRWIKEQGERDEFYMWFTMIAILIFIVLMLVLAFGGAR